MHFWFFGFTNKKIRRNKKKTLLRTHDSGGEEPTRSDQFPEAPTIETTKVASVVSEQKPIKWPLLSFCILRIPTTTKGISHYYCKLHKSMPFWRLFGVPKMRWCFTIWWQLQQQNFKTFVQATWVIWPLDLHDVVTRTLSWLSFQQFSNSKLKSTQVAGFFSCWISGFDVIFHVRFFMPPLTVKCHYLWRCLISLLGFKNPSIFWQPTQTCCLNSNIRIFFPWNLATLVHWVELSWILFCLQVVKNGSDLLVRGAPIDILKP
jgi:hypothetical protein